jgi:hypothetical protein
MMRQVRKVMEAQFGFAIDRFHLTAWSGVNSQTLLLNSLPTHHCHIHSQCVKGLFTLIN